MIWLKGLFVRERILTNGEIKHIENSSYNSVLDEFGYSAKQKEHILREFYKSKDTPTKNKE